MANAPTETVYFTLTEQDKRALRIFAAERGVPMTVVLRDLIRASIFRQRASRKGWPSEHATK